MQFKKKKTFVFFSKKKRFFSHKKLGLQKNPLKSVFFNTHLKEITR